MHQNVQEVLLEEGVIQKRVKELGREISFDYTGMELMVTGILKGAMIFMADLIRALEINVSLDFVMVSSYGKGHKSSGAVSFLKNLEQSIEGRHVLIVEDIVDTGLTLNYLVQNFQARKPASLKICALLDKPCRHKVEVKVNYCGFTIPDCFVVGYGLDFGEYYRNLPYIAVLKPEVYERKSSK